MNFYVHSAFSMSVGIGAVAGWIRFNRTSTLYRPFLLLLTAGFCNEVFSFILLHNGYSNALNYSLFSLAESLLISWQFWVWGLFGGRKKVYYFIQLLFAGLWAGDHFFVQLPVDFGPYFIIFHAFILVVMSIQQVNMLLFAVQEPLWRQPVFVICTGFIIYFLFAILVEIFMVIGLRKTAIFRMNSYTLLSCINLIVNLLFAYAVLCFPLSIRFIMR